MAKRIGLTGGVAVGKSTVSRYLMSRGVPVIDADQIAREVVAPGEVGLQRLVARFGDGILHADGTLNRQHLAALIFRQEDDRQEVNRLLHPLIFEKIDEALSAYVSEAFVIIDMPLLFETAYEQRVDAVIVVTTTADIQRQRLAERLLQTHGPAQDAHERAQLIDQMIASQWPLAEKVARADMIIDNSGTREATFQQVDAILVKLYAASDESEED